MKRVALLAASAAVVVQFTGQDITALQTFGHEIHILCPMQNPPVSEQAMDLFNETYPNLIWHDVPLENRFLYVRQNHTAMQTLKELLQKLHPDLLHCHGTIAGYYGRRALMELKLDIPCFYTAHDFRVYHGSPWFERMIMGAVERKYSKVTTAFLPVCTADQKYAQKHLSAKTVQPAPAFNLEYDYYANPKRSAAEMRKELAIPDNAMVLLSVGELRMEKRLRIVLQAMARLRSRKDLCYVICGDGPDLPFLQRLTEKLHLTSRVHFLGYRTDIPDLLGMADIFCMPSRHEACGMAAIEAMAAGLPLITVREHATIDYAHNGEGAFCLKGDLVASCADAIEQLCDNKLLRKQMGAHNRAAAKAFSEEGIMMRMRMLYQENLKD